MSTPRRAFLQSTAALGVASLAPLTLLADEKEKAPKKEEEEIPATEDLMREHGVLNRALLVYEELLRRTAAKEEVTPAMFQRTAELIRHFIEDYHEKLEENFIFPIFEKHQKHTELVKVLRRQHDVGRTLTERILRSSQPDEFRRANTLAQLSQDCHAFIRMYRPHEAREDTVLFPALRKILPAKEIEELGERFEKEEHRVVGGEGFEKAVEQVAEIEKQLGIYELDKFTP
jgi:hemerythrin-like domain-containing protein